MLQNTLCCTITCYVEVKLGNFRTRLRVAVVLFLILEEREREREMWVVSLDHAV
jgi:hypothetical protein